jgi:hypothetical protein
MKKVAVAAAVAGAFATSATAAELSTFIYQDYNLSFNSASVTGAADYDDMTVGDAGSNMVNFNYSDDLGNGLGLIGSFSMTARGTNATTAAGGNGNRNSFIGLTGDFGKVTIGTHELMAELEVILKDGWDANYGGGGDPVRITRIAGTGTATTDPGHGFTQRVYQSVEWTSGDMNGLTLNASLIENGGSTAAVDAQGTEINAIYNMAGGIRLSAGVGSHDDYGGTAGDTMEFTYVTAAYDFGTFSIAGSVSEVESKVGSTVYQQSGSHLNITMPTASGRVIFNYASQGDRDEAGVAQANSGFSGYDIGYMHDASANTKLYVRFLSSSVDADYDWDAAASDKESLQLGMRYVY